MIPPYQTEAMNCIACGAVSLHPVDVIKMKEEGTSERSSVEKNPKNEKCKSAETILLLGFNWRSLKNRQLSKDF